jgi:hypothetical protein
MNDVAKTKGQVADDYGICIRTLNKWLKAENIVINSGLISPRQQTDIKRRLGKPQSQFNKNYIDKK